MKPVCMSSFVGPVRKPKFSFWELFFRVFTVPRLLWLGSFCFCLYYFSENAKSLSGSNSSDAVSSKHKLLPECHQFVVLAGIVLAALLMVEGIAPELAFFSVIFAWFLTGQVYEVV